MSTTDRWEPDAQLIAAVLAGSPTTMSDLAQADRCWAVAGLVLAGLTAEDIADRLACSLRAVRAVRADPMTQLCIMYQQEADHFASELRLARAELGRAVADRRDCTAEAQRLHRQLGHLIAARSAEPGRCGNGHPRDAVNLYLRPDGRPQCRACAADRQRAYRQRRALRCVTLSAAPA